MCLLVKPFNHLSRHAMSITSHRRNISGINCYNSVTRISWLTSSPMIIRLRHKGKHNERQSRVTIQHVSKTVITFSFWCLLAFNHWWNHQHSCYIQTYLLDLTQIWPRTHSDYGWRWERRVFKQTEKMHTKRKTRPRTYDTEMIICLCSYDRSKL